MFIELCHLIHMLCLLAGFLPGLPGDYGTYLKGGTLGFQAWLSPTSDVNFVLWWPP